MNTNDRSFLTRAKWLTQATKSLKSAGIGTARLDCLVLMEDVLDKDRTHLLAHLETEMTREQLNKLDTMIERRTKHEPLAYIRGKAEFYGHEFVINSHVLVPRPESETMIDLLKKLPLDKHTKIADIGSGSGALGITAALELHLETDLIEIDDGALDVSRMNAEKHKVKVKLIKSDLLKEANESYDVILANLPYVPEDFTINQAAVLEPPIAIFGGPDGLDIYRRLFQQIVTIPKKPKYILTESLPSQHEKLDEIAKKAGFKSRKTDDFIQVFA